MRRPADCTGSAHPWSMRCRCGWTSRSTGTAKTHGVSFHRGVPGVFAGTDPGRRVHPAQRAAGPQEGAADAHRHPHPLLGRPADLPARRGALARGAARARAADRIPGPGPRLTVRDQRPGARSDRGDVPLRRRHRRLLRVPGARRGRQRRAPPARRRPLPGDGPGPRREGPPGPARRRAGGDRRHRAALGRGLRSDVRSFVNIIATPKGGTHLKASSAPWSRPSTSAAGGEAAQGQ